MKNRVTQEQINDIFEKTVFNSTTMFDKCTVVVAKLPNGFVITESSACIDKENYDYEIGKKICLEKIKNKIWELEGYKLQCEMYK